MAARTFRFTFLRIDSTSEDMSCAILHTLFQRHIYTLSSTKGNQPGAQTWLPAFGTPFRFWYSQSAKNGAIGAISSDSVSRHSYKGLVSAYLILLILALPEAAATQAHIPVAQVFVQEVFHSASGLCRLVVVHIGGHIRTSEWSDEMIQRSISGRVYGIYFSLNVKPSTLAYSAKNWYVLYSVPKILPLNFFNAFQIKA
jgi:hypothetical protein